MRFELLPFLRSPSGRLSFLIKGVINPDLVFSEAANALQQAGLIRYTRGKITILNRQELEAASCECYEIINGEFARLLSTGC
jgi:hypothetical protein